MYSEASEHRKISISALEEVILKQTREIQGLKSDLANERDSTSARTASWERRVHELNERAESAERARKQAADETSRVASEFEKYRAEKERELGELRSRCDELRDEKTRVVEEAEGRVRAAGEEARRLGGELAQLRIYVNESMPTVETVREMSEERQRCEAELVRLKIRNEQIVGENNALQIRLKSINEILSIQEKQLETKQAQKWHGLLNRWRTKVFELMVQLRSDELERKRERSEAEKSRRECEERLEAESSRVKILENVVEDKRAEVSVLVGDKTALSEQVSRLRESNEELERRRAEDARASGELKSQVEKLVREYVRIEESFRVANKRLSQLDQRVEFAKNRLGVVKALYAAQAKHQQQQQQVDVGKRGNSLNTISMLSTIYGSANLNEAQISSLDVFGTAGGTGAGPSMMPKSMMSHQDQDDERLTVSLFSFNKLIKIINR